MKHNVFAVVGVLFLGVVATGCRPMGRQPQPDNTNEALSRKLDDIQSHLTVVSEQLDELKQQQEQPIAPINTKATGLTLNPVIPVQPEPTSTEADSKRKRLADLANRYPTTQKSKKSSKKASGSKPSSLKAKHIRVPVSVSEIQRALKNAGFNPGPIDGKVGAKTIAAIRQYQASAGLKVDGIVGPATWRKMSSGGISRGPASPVSPAVPATVPPSNDLLPPPADGFTF